MFKLGCTVTWKIAQVPLESKFASIISLLGWKLHPQEGKENRGDLFIYFLNRD